jgi:hypothetical protein
MKEGNTLMKRSALAIALIAALSGCGSGGEDGGSSSNTNTNSGAKSGSIKIDNISIKEGNSGNSDAKVRVTRSGGKDGVIKGKFRTTPGTALSDQDYLETVGEFELQDGVARIDLVIPIIGDVKDEDDETFSVQIFDVSGASSIERDTATVTITNDDSSPEISFTSEIRTTSEGSGRVKIPLQLNTSSGKDVSVSYELSGLAINGQDYSVISDSTIVFPAGTTEQFLELDIVQDDVPEGGETIKIKLTEANNATLSKQFETSVIILGDLVLNDTGVTRYVNGNDFDAQGAPNDLPGQDAEFGADTDSPNYLDGYAGFSFTKLDVSGNHLPHTATAWSCVLDNRTGIVWENKGDAITDIPSSLSEAEFKALVNDAWSASRNPSSKDYVPYPYYHWHQNWQAKNYLYTWYSKDRTNDGGSAGGASLEFQNRNAPVHNKAQCAFPTTDNAGYVKVTSCSTDDYIRAANELAVCGYKDWRLPSIEELRSIANYENSQTLLDTDYFYNYEGGAPIWSGTPSSNGEGTAWCMDSSNGQAKLCHKQSNSASIRLARGGKQ